VIDVDHQRCAPVLQQAQEVGEFPPNSSELSSSNDGPLVGPDNISLSISQEEYQQIYDIMVTKTPPVKKDNCLFRIPVKHHKRLLSLCADYPEMCETCLERFSNLKYNFKLQSGDIECNISTETDTLASTKEQTVEFFDSNTGEFVGMPSMRNIVGLADATPQVSLEDFLSRPVVISTINWTEAQTIYTNLAILRPWQLFFNDARIKYKLNNYAFLSCDLKIKVMINASPFYYGAVLINYNPLISFNNPLSLFAASPSMIPLSQRPKMLIYPQASEGATMTLPFFWHKNYLNVQSNQDFLDMGLLRYEILSALRSANAATGSGVTITTYAWAENVKLSGASVGLSLQSGDEYGTGPVSLPASAIANAASKLEKVPVLGMFATATKIGATAISNIASLFGFTNVPVISDTMPFKPCPFPQFASPEIGYPVEKLTLDPKNELAIDPGVVGLSSKDELVISNLAGKESYLCQTLWSTTHAVDTILFSSNVTPQLFDVAAGSILYQTPMCWLSTMFLSWRGPIIFRFKMVASPYHKGRVRITYDPSGYAGENIISDAVSSTVAFNQVVDLSVDTDVEIEVPYQQARSWLQGYNGFTSFRWTISNSPAFIHDASYDNGTITMRVLNILSAPVLTSDVSILVFVRAGEGFQLANPIPVPENLTYFALQSGDVYGEPTSIMAGNSEGTNDPNLNLVYYGETVKSLRTLLRRTNLSYVITPTTSILDQTFGMLKHKFDRFPLFKGYDTAGGIHTAKGLTATGTTFKYNFVHNTIYNWLAPAFKAQRGSMIWSFNAQNDLQSDSVKVFRVPNNNAAASDTYVSINKGTTSANASYYSLNTDSGAAGMSLISQKTNAGISVLCPNYAGVRMQNTFPASTSVPTSIDDRDHDGYMLELALPGNISTTTTNFSVWCYESIGTDFNLHFFLNVPSMNILSGDPVPV
jgi:hypothetical protein